MSEQSPVNAQSTPRLAPHMRLRFDRTRQNWTIQAPERAFVLDGVAEAIVSRCDGSANILTVVDSLCDAFPEAPRNTIETDVMTLIQGFVDKGVMLP
jgi:pyrroloquinoline quinone biosynthesis protein D